MVVDQVRTYTSRRGDWRSGVPECDGYKRPRVMRSGIL